LLVPRGGRVGRGAPGGGGGLPSTEVVRGRKAGAGMKTWVGSFCPLKSEIARQFSRPAHPVMEGSAGKIRSAARSAGGKPFALRPAEVAKDPTHLEAESLPAPYRPVAATSDRLLMTRLDNALPALDDRVPPLGGGPSASAPRAPR
jgi:hypothetical protein